MQVVDEFTDITARPRDFSSDWNVKSGGAFKEGGLLKSSSFTVLVCASAAGKLEMAVPTIDAPLVADCLQRRRSAGG